MTMTEHARAAWRRWRRAVPRQACGALCALSIGAAPAAAQDAFADGVAAFVPGINGEFGAELLPDIVLGPPRGAGAVQGSFDVVALGIGGSITLRFDLPVICDGPGADFIVFENAFHSGSASGPLFTEYVFVAVSQDGEHFIELPYDAASGVGLAGRTPVYSHPDNDISPLDPLSAGGDAFDLAASGLAWAAYVRLTDVGGTPPDFGDLPQFRVAPNAGADIDAVAAVHACDPASVASPTPTATPVGGDATPTPTPSPSPTPEASPSATATGALLGDLTGDGVVSGADLTWLIAELFDGDGDAVGAAAGGAVASGAAADTNLDARLTAADLIALMRRRSQ